MTAPTFEEVLRLVEQLSPDDQRRLQTVLTTAAESVRAAQQQRNQAAIDLLDAWAADAEDTDDSWWFGFAEDLDAHPNLGSPAVFRDIRWAASSFLMPARWACSCAHGVCRLPTSVRSGCARRSPGRFERGRAEEMEAEESTSLFRCFHLHCDRRSRRPGVAGYTDRYRSSAPHSAPIPSATT